LSTKFNNCFCCYFCDANIAIRTDDTVITSAKGLHRDGKLINDVKLLDFNNDDSTTRDVYFIPSGIGDVFPSLRILYIQLCKLTRLSRKNFKRMSVLSTISLSDNQIHFIDEDTFYEVPQLYSLRINGNHLKSLPSSIFMNSICLQHFICDTNFFETFDGNLLRNNPSLVSINLEENQLRSIKINLKSFSNLQKVNLRNNICINAFVEKGSSETILQVQEKINKSCA
jgi:Leucine-rich repeat (LRR) protein